MNLLESSQVRSLICMLPPPFPPAPGHTFQDLGIQSLPYSQDRDKLFPLYHRDLYFPYSRLPPSSVFRRLRYDYDYGGRYQQDDIDRNEQDYMPLRDSLDRSSHLMPPSYPYMRTFRDSRTQSLTPSQDPHDPTDFHYRDLPLPSRRFRPSVFTRLRNNNRKYGYAHCGGYNQVRRGRYRNNRFYRRHTNRQSGFVMEGLSVSPSPNNSRSPSPLAWRKRDRYYRSPDRHRDHLRRRSRSHSHRHRRRSPSPRYKRSRRDYDDRRHGSDYRGRYERGGREDRYYGRRSDRRSDSPDSWSISSEDSSNAGGTQRVGLMSYKQFILELEDDILPAEAEHRYEEYKLEYITAQKRAYFEAHKDDDWLREKYHPTNLVTVIQRRDWKARTSAKEFFLDLQSGALDVGPGLTAATLNNSEQEAHKNSYDEADINGRRQKHIHGPPDTSDGVSSAPRAPPVSSEPRRIQIDVVQAQDLVRKLDSEKGIKDNILCNSDNGEQSHTGFTGPIVIIRGLKSVKGLEGEELLDTLVTYLWRVHHLDYYGMSEKTDAKGLRHVRSEIKTADESDPAGVDWEKKLDSFWQERLCGQDPLEIMLAKEKLDVAAVAAFNPIVRKIEDEKFGLKYGCGAKGCSKLFHGAEYVHKHLKLKHPDLVVALTSQVREDLYFQNYMNDANAPGGTPLLQRSAPDKVIRHSQVSDRLRDERGNYRERDRNDRFTDAERYTRSEGSPFGNPTGGLNTSKSDELMHDAYGGRGLADTYFPSDAPPPPVLMPVPGAGPLGPFVPAPPEVANRLLKEQGVPTLNGGPHGRKGRPGPQMGGSMPIFAVAPAMGHDPRQIRSYRDLDAPNEEVKVIDYRSLV